MTTQKQYLRWKKTMSIFKKIFHCHQLPNRSFHIKNFQLPLCARCTGLFLGMFFLAPIISIFTLGRFYISFSFIVIMIFDGVLQFTTSYESNNPKRLITGLGAGYGVTSLIIQLFCFIF